MHSYKRGNSEYYPIYIDLSGLRNPSEALIEVFKSHGASDYTI